ncbi:MAG: hypothetical protein ABIP94_22910 [Planctomycetota bacterium]
MTDAIERVVDADDATHLTLVDLLLAQGSPSAQAALREKVANEPQLALEMAETVALIEQFRQLRVEPSAQFAGQLADIVHRAERRISEPRASWWKPALAMAAAAALTFAALWQWGPRGGEKRQTESVRASAFELQRASGAGAAGATESSAVAALEFPTQSPRVAPRVAPTVATQTVAIPPSRIVQESAEVAWQSMVEVMRNRLDMEPSPRLSEALNSRLQAPRDSLGSWLDPRNALVLLRLDHELRASAELRRRAMRNQGGMEAADARVQELADQIAAELVAVTGTDGASVGEVALAVRAQIAAGSSSAARAAAVAAGSEWLATRLPTYSDANLVAALASLVEVAAVQGTYTDLVAAHGERLVAEVLRAEDAWKRRRPALLTGRIDAATLGCAGRLLRLLPGLGTDAARCGLVRQLVLGRLQERRDAGEDGPDVLVAMVYGCCDLMPEAERDEVERQLSRWKPVRLVPDFVTVQQYAWAIEPGRLGFTRLQRELRRLSILPAPTALDERAAFCLSLATNYAAFHDQLPFSIGD